MLLALGFGAGAVGALDPNALLGEQLISAVVSVAVGIILFEAGLGLKLSKLTGDVARVSRRLVTSESSVTWAIGRSPPTCCSICPSRSRSCSARCSSSPARRWSGRCSSFIRPSKKVNLVLKWRAPWPTRIGATLGVVVFNAVIAGHAKAGEEIFQFLLNVGVGVGLGVAGAALILAWARMVQAQPVTGRDRDVDVRRRDGRRRRSAP